MTDAWSRRAGLAAITAAATLLAAAGCASDAPEMSTAVADSEWAHYGGDAGGTKYAPLAQVNRDNIARLRVAWMARTDHADTGGVIAIARGQEPVSARTHPHPARPPGRSRVRFETTPLKVWGTVYVATPRGRVLALDPASGELRWSFDARLDAGRHLAEGLTTRGLAAWSDPGAAPGTRCGRRIFLATVDARLLALDAADGTLCTDFGDRGEVDLLQGAGQAGEAAEPSRYTVTSPPAVLEDVVVVGSAVNKTADQDAPSGVVRAFDARGGALRWSFDPIPRDEAHPAWTSWTPEAARTTGGANVWSLISADPERGLIFLPTASAAPDFYGGGRPGRNDHANSVVALRAASSSSARRRTTGSAPSTSTRARCSGSTASRRAARRRP